ncbi:Histone-lysine N-methyltransferase ATXR2 [Apostasia shenzhenica]|uniref:Histone-lysine N-methyltransferase ATXR2 n=1 Tax=Apostasia shenzhenica TaxID=1088818 RepID=A0A2I0B7D5_9ASPA|nr:Histone-lysine N-methyltransferase ATXR2 [Apostasia shenzhenica]
MEASPCPLEVEFSNQIAALLAPPSSKSIQEYYDGLLHETKSHFIRVEFNENGKGVFSNRDFKEEHLVLKDQMLVAAQHSSNKVDCFVCSRCFCYIGSVEVQIGRKLYLESLGLTTMDCDHQSEDQSFLQENDDETGSSAHKNNSFSMDVLQLLMDGNLFLPYSKQFTLPTIVACPGGCEEEHYCSKLCADIDWDTVHSLLCTGKTSDSFRQAALVKFTEHANRTNDIFILAAKVISFTILRYRRLKRSYLEGSKQPILNEAEGQSNLCILSEAWKPVAMGFKRRWWDCIALPDDIDSCQEASFRMQIRDLAFTSLQLLKEAIFDVECAPCILQESTAW